MAALQLRRYFSCQFIVTAIALIFHFEKYYHPKVDMCHYKKAIFVGEDILNILKTFSFFFYFLLWRCSRLCLIILNFVFLVDAQRNVVFLLFSSLTVQLIICKCRVGALRILAFHQCVPGSILSALWRKSFLFWRHISKSPVSSPTLFYISPEVKFQVFERLKYGEEKSIRENFTLVKENHKEYIEQIKICHFHSNASHWSIIVFVSTGSNMKIQVN